MNALPAQHDGQNGAHHHNAAHSHQHTSSARAERSRRRLLLVLALTALYMVAEAVGGWLTGSLALLADAGHMLTDVAALTLALIAVWFGSRPATPSKTFGYHRLEILAALVNGVALVVMALLIFYHAYERWHTPRPVESNLMIVVAVGGLMVNLVSAWLLHGDHHDDLNMRGAWLHIMGDALGSVGAIIAGVLMSVYGWYQADALFSAGIAVLIIWSSWHLIKESTNVLLEGTPAHINLASVEEAIRTTAGVEGVDALQVPTFPSGREALSAHVVHAPTIVQPELLKELRVKLHDRFGVDHLTLQMETGDFEDETFHFCHAG
ncbi:MAG TPA: cation diffusion facilitator family transporter, partial [Pyrinomonadaceae bacterium]|nr:cation diffusion facilitator family transporter [Pyrinomonadaceae bacterium]